MTGEILLMIKVSEVLQHCSEIHNVLMNGKTLTDGESEGLESIVSQQYHAHWMLRHNGSYDYSPDGIQACVFRIDDWISDQLQELKVECVSSSSLNTETPGLAFERLCNLLLDLKTLEDGQQDETELAGNRQVRQQELAICMLQIDDISQSLQILLDDIFAGRKRHRSYQQFRMYNDPEMNAYLHQAARRLAG